jgi:hypothetical protein
MKRMTWALFLLLGFLPGVAHTSAAEAARKVPERIEALITRLGSPSFEEREEAARELAELGRTAEVALREGTKHADAEVRRRCQELLAVATRTEMEIALDDYLADGDTRHLLKVPAWKNFSKVGGDSPSSRNLFVKMCGAEGSLLALAEKDPKAAGAQLSARCMELQQMMRTGLGIQASMVSPENLAVFLYLGSDSRINSAAGNTYFTCVYTFLNQPAVKQTFQTDAAARKLLVNYVKNNKNSATIYLNIYIVQNYQLKEAADTLIDMAAAKSTPATYRAQALCALPRLGANDKVARLQPLLSDEATVGATTRNTVRFTIQVRDVALAMSILLSGDDISAYPFPILKQQPQQAQVWKNNPATAYYSYSYLGFTDDKERALAFKMWEERSAKLKK